MLVVQALEQYGVLFVVCEQEGKKTIWWSVHTGNVTVHVFLINICTTVIETNK